MTQIFILKRSGWIFTKLQKRIKLVCLCRNFQSADQSSQNVKLALEEVVLQYTYPRLDAEVSKHRNHLLKAPFCVHPKTGRVCVPVDPETVDTFDPANVPTVGRLLQELDAGKIQDSASEDTRSGMYTKTAPASSFHHFYRLGEDFAETLCRSSGSTCQKYYERGQGRKTEIWSVFNSCC